MAATTERATLVLDLFDRYYERVYAFLRKSTTPDVAEDLAQEVFVRLLQHPDLERLTISISYLLKIAHNLLRRRYARAARLRELLEERVQQDGGLDEGAPRRDEPAVDVESDILETALGLLSKDEQDAIRLIVCEGKSYQHAAEALGVSVTTINNWKHRGIVKLRELVTTDRVTAPSNRREPSITITTNPIKVPRTRAGRTETGKPSQGGPGSGTGPVPGAARNLFAWRSAQDDVA
jgi:RNA polymerase sigma factor (sigma-70 family)